MMFQDEDVFASDPTLDFPGLVNHLSFGEIALANLQSRRSVEAGLSSFCVLYRVIDSSNNNGSDRR